MMGWTRRLARGEFAAALVLAALWGGVSSASSFTLDPVLTRGTANPADDLLAAARWSFLPGSLVRHGVRGLGGGLEYAIAPDFCARLRPRFVDRPAPSCGRILMAIDNAFAVWAEGHGDLYFIDVSAKIAPKLPPPGTRQPWRGYGSEIDIFALPPSAYRRLKKFAAFTGFWYKNENPRTKNGGLAPGVTITNADMVFNTTSCYHLDPALAGRGCNHFPSLVVHEITHLLALGHPNENRRRNFDNDGNPHNRVTIDCADPTRGLGLSSALDPEAVANSSLGRPAPVRMRLSNDDIAGRNFLYPACG